MLDINSSGPVWPRCFSWFLQMLDGFVYSQVQWAGFCRGAFGRARAWGEGGGLGWWSWVLLTVSWAWMGKWIFDKLPCIYLVLENHGENFGEGYQQKRRDRCPKPFFFQNISISILRNPLVQYVNGIWEADMGFWGCHFWGVLGEIPTPECCWNGVTFTR